MPLETNIENELTREAQFSAFVNGPLLDFWQRREEAEFSGVDNIPIRYVRFRSSHHTKVVMLVTGRIESYVKYPEVAYDLFQQGYDVMVLDHRGQGRSGRMLPDPHRGHVVNFDDYVEDFSQWISIELSNSHYLERYALAHSMGGAILLRYLMRDPTAFDAVALCAPMLGIHLPMPKWLAHRIVNWTESHKKFRDYYAIGTGQWRPLPFIVNMLTHSRERYRRCLRHYADTPEIRVGGPTYHWVRESLNASEQIIAEADKITTPVLLLQASEDRVVSNPAQDAFCQAMAQAGHPCDGGAPRVIKGARHEILFERDTLRVEALSAILRFFAQHHQPRVPADANSTRG
ncbi:prolyl oligopeptidase family protein [Yersinia ruckeri]|uniref:lysophospholipase L2 n=1 Tax=Yersinia ruckeri TaxID=29486 RepID=UPI0005ABD2A3|nr:lysophospholipase L2 [Yersinia ruckeri]AJI93980.1 prolyl oligopeptidase family protein [Yersinia ruckeri]MCW6569035.1 lysophospholipase L2 [Yersinia ruckeri]